MNLKPFRFLPPMKTYASTLNYRIYENILITRPTRNDIENLRIGALAPTVFGDMRRVTRIAFRRSDAHGFLSVGYLTMLSRYPTLCEIEHVMREHYPVVTVPAINCFGSVENFPFWDCRDEDQK